MITKVDSNYYRGNENTEVEEDGHELYKIIKLGLEENYIGDPEDPA